MSAPWSAVRGFQLFAAQLLRPTTSVKNLIVLISISISSSSDLWSRNKESELKKNLETITETGMFYAHKSEHETELRFRP